MKLRLSLATVLLLSCMPAFGQDEKAEDAPKPEVPPEVKKRAETMVALRNGNVEEFLKLTEGTEDELFAGFRADLMMRRGQQRFYDADIEGSLADFNEVARLLPDKKPHLWQRGIALYYAEKYQEGKEQFEIHQDVNSQDVENAVWHFLCAVRAPGGSVDVARKNLIPISGDTRVPMKEIHDLFSGKGTAEAVIAAAQKQGNPQKSEQAKNAMLYAHLYLGIYYEAIGETEKMKEHIAKSAGEFKMDHYMGKVAQVHAKLRGITGG